PDWAKACPARDERAIELLIIVSKVRSEVFMAVFPLRARSVQRKRPPRTTTSQHMTTRAHPFREL
ncbi:MAG: hypothetical protein ACK5TJ_02760, partial [Brevundimonas sp.]